MILLFFLSLLWLSLLELEQELLDDNFSDSKELVRSDSVSDEVACEEAFDDVEELDDNFETFATKFSLLLSPFLQACFD